MQSGLFPLLTSTTCYIVMIQYSIFHCYFYEYFSTPLLSLCYFQEKLNIVSTVGCGRGRKGHLLNHNFEGEFILFFEAKQKTNIFLTKIAVLTCRMMINFGSLPNDPYVITIIVLNYLIAHNTLSNTTQFPLITIISS